MGGSASLSVRCQSCTASEIDSSNCLPNSEQRTAALHGELLIRHRSTTPLADACDAAVRHVHSGVSGDLVVARRVALAATVEIVGVGKNEIQRARKRLF